MAVLDSLSGFEFEDVIEDVFRNLGYENVRQADRTADEGRDVLMEEVVDGTRRAIVVECKHTASVGRPVVQKLHSAITTFDFDGPKRGMVVTSGRFTEPATTYAARLQRNGDPHQIELIDGADLRDISGEIGLDLYNGRIEILCDETLRPVDPSGSVLEPMRDAFRDIRNIDGTDIPEPSTHVEFRPVVSITANIDAVFETTVGVIHHINEMSQFVAHADRAYPVVADVEVKSLVGDNLHTTLELDEEGFAERFDVVDIGRFGQTETEYKNWAVDRLRDHYTSTVTYTGDNNVTYDKTCEPNRSDITVTAIEPVFLPEIRLTVDLLEYRHSFEYFAAGPSRVTKEDRVRRCVQCTTDDRRENYTFCTNCGSINCSNHTKIERLEGTPVCTGCGVTERFALKTKYFYDEDNLEAFREEYEAMPIYRKPLENIPLVVGSLVATLVSLILLVSSLGLI